MKKLTPLLLAVCALVLAPQAHAGAAKTTYPVVFAHGMGGFDNILGYDYWGDDYGMYVGDACDVLFETDCNEDIDAKQASFVGKVQPFQTSEVRGLDLANQIEGYMASAGVTRVNLIGHSQGGMDIRKAAKTLYQRKGYTVVAVLVSVSSPHRGSPVAKYVLDLKPGVTSVIAALAKIYGDVVNRPGNDGYAGAKQLVYNDYSATDGITTGAKAFNVNNPIDSRYASRYVSLLTAQKRLERQPRPVHRQGVLLRHGRGRLLHGRLRQRRRRGQGQRQPPATTTTTAWWASTRSRWATACKYTESTFGFDSVSNDAERALPGQHEHPQRHPQMTSTSSVINQDHLDVVGVGPDTFDEPEFYAAIFQYIGTYD